MGSLSALPALDVKTPQQPDLLEKYGQLQQLRGNQQAMQQLAALAPLQQQEAQQSVQSGQLDIQQKQIALKDQQALSAAMQQWGKPPVASSTQPASADGTAPAAPTATQPNYDDLIDLAKKNGASFNAIKGIQTYALDMKAKASTIAKDDAQTGASNANALKTKIGLVNDALTGVVNLPDQQLAQGIMAAASDLSQKGLIDPQHVQQAQALAQQAQSGDVAGARQHLQMQINSTGGFANAITEAQKKLNLEQDQGKTDPTSPLYAPTAASVAMGTAPGAAQIQSGEAKQAGAKAASEAAARQPYEMALARQRQALTQGDPNAAGQLLVNGDATLSELKSRGATPQFIENALTAAHRLSGGKYNAQSADAQFDVAKSPANVAFFGSSKSLTDKGGTLDQLSAAAKDIPGGLIPAFNSIADWEKAATGSGPIAKYAALALGVADDYAKVMGGGQGSDSSRMQALNLVGAKQSPAQREGSISGIRGAVGSQTNSRIGNNPVLGRMYGSPAQSAPARPAGVPTSAVWNPQGNNGQGSWRIP